MVSSIFPWFLLMAFIYFGGFHCCSIVCMFFQSIVFYRLFPWCSSRGKGRKLAWQGDGHESQKVAQRRSLLGDAEGHVQREAKRCSLRQLSHTHTEWYGCSCYWYPQAGIEPATKLLPNQPGEGGRGRVVKWEVMYVGGNKDENIWFLPAVARSKWRHSA